jgi:hypothetical protein
MKLFGALHRHRLNGDISPDLPDCRQHARRVA